MTTFEHLLVEAYDGLTTRERLLADLLLRKPELILVSSATDLAQMAAVSNSTVTRFVKSLGYEGYDVMRRALRDSYGHGSPLSLVSQERAEMGAGMISAFARQEADILEQTLSRLDEAELDRICDALVKARQLGFLGMRNSHFFAAYAHWQFVQFRKGTRLITGTEGTSAEFLAEYGPGDVVVVVGVRRIVERLGHCLEVLADAGADILLIADGSSLHLAARAKWTLLCPVENQHVFDSYSGVLGVLRLLAFLTLQKTGEAGLAHMALIERQHDALNEL